MESRDTDNSKQEQAKLRSGIGGEESIKDDFCASGLL